MCVIIWWFSHRRHTAKINVKITWKVDTSDLMIKINELQISQPDHLNLNGTVEHMQLAYIAEGNPDD